MLAEPRRGHVIALLTLRDVGEIYELRLWLEPPPPRPPRAGSPPTSSRTCARARSRRSTSTPRLGRAVHGGQPRRARRRRHRGGNRRAALIVARLLDDSERARLVALRAGAGGRGLRARDEHRALLAALEAGDGEEAARLMAVAIRAFRDELLDALRDAVVDAPLP